MKNSISCYIMNLTEQPTSQWVVYWILGWFRMQCLLRNKPSAHYDSTTILFFFFLPFTSMSSGFFPCLWLLLTMYNQNKLFLNFWCHSTWYYTSCFLTSDKLIPGSFKKNQYLIPVLILGKHRKWRLELKARKSLIQRKWLYLVKEIMMKRLLICCHCYF